MNLIEQFRGFCKASYGKLGAAELGLYLRLLEIWNERGRPDWIAVSYSEIQASLKAGSHNSIKKWREGLEKGGYIETRSQGDRKPIEIKLVSFPTMSKNDIVAPATMSKNDIALCQNLTYTMSKNDIVEASSAPQGDADEALSHKGWRAAPTMSKNDPHREREYIQRYIKDTDTSNLESVAPPEKAVPCLSDDVRRIFEESVMPIMSASQLEQLAVWERDYGYLEMVDAIKITAKANVAASRKINFLGGVLKNRREDMHDKSRGQRQTKRAYRASKEEERREKFRDEAEKSRGDARPADLLKITGDINP